MTEFQDYINKIAKPDHQQQVLEVLQWIQTRFPMLKPELKWNQPMFTHHGTFIFGLSVATKHISFAPERAGMIAFEETFQNLP